MAKYLNIEEMVIPNENRCRSENYKLIISKLENKKREVRLTKYFTLSFSGNYFFYCLLEANLKS